MVRRTRASSGKVVDTGLTFRSTRLYMVNARARDVGFLL